VTDDPLPTSSKNRDFSSSVDAAKSTNSLPPNSLVGLVAASEPNTIVEPDPWTYRGDSRSNNSSALSPPLPVVHEQQQQQQVQHIWSELYEFGVQTTLNPWLHTIPSDTNDDRLVEVFGLEKAINHATTPVPVMEYSCGSLVYESSSLCESDPNDPIPVKTAPSLSASLQNSAQWGTTSISMMDMNKSAISAMDFSSASLDWLAYENVEDKGNIETTLLDSSVTTMDLSTSYKSGLTPPVVPSEEPARNAYTARYDFLRREESVDTAIAGNLRHHSHLDASLSESFNMSLDLSQLPPPGDSREGSRVPVRLDFLLNSSGGDWKKKLHGGECSSSGELDVR
jgi:hypothetical protein